MSDGRANNSRPTKYKPEFVEQVRQLCQLGATDFQIAKFFGVHRATIYRWSANHEDFCDAIKSGGAKADDLVERSLYERARGYSYESEKVFQFQGEAVRAKTIEHVPPDTTACIFWLKNRRKNEWRDRHDLEHNIGQETLDALSDADLTRIATSGSGSARNNPAGGSG